eukprot:scaffold132385_cov69-Phaeocystis_antarctica.AAC.2
MLRPSDESSALYSFTATLCPFQSALYTTPEVPSPTLSPRDRSVYATCCSEPRGGAGTKHGLPATASQVRRGIACSHSGRRLCAKHGRYGRPARGRLPSGRGWPRLEAALSLLWRWWGALEGELVEASGRLLSTEAAAAAGCWRGAAALAPASPPCYAAARPALHVQCARGVRTQRVHGVHAVHMQSVHMHMHMHMRMGRTVVGEHQLAHQHELADLVRQLGQPVVGEDEPLERHGQRHVHGAQRAALEGEHAQLRQLRDRWRHLVAVRGRARGRLRFRLGREFGPGLGLGPRSGSGPGLSGAIGLRSLTLTLATPPPRSRWRGGTAPRGRAVAQPPKLGDGHRQRADLAPLEVERFSAGRVVGREVAALLCRRAA